ncbi:uncharacterized protein PAE49_003566 isoform 1-T1 [Odontesthes bonariensis]
MAVENGLKLHSREVEERTPKRRRIQNPKIAATVTSQYGCNESLEGGGGKQSELQRGRRRHYRGCVTDLCAVLQARLEANPKYSQSHHRRVKETPRSQLLIQDEDV